jgi:two-component system, chemotaxis family, protein-glutamate methylesterase/glutaminase
VSTAVVLDDHALRIFPGLDAALAKAGALVMRSFKNTPNPLLLARHPGVGVVGGSDKAGLLARLERATTALAGVPAPVIGILPPGVPASRDLLGPGVVDLLPAGTPGPAERIAERILLMARVPLVTGGPNHARAAPGIRPPASRPFASWSPVVPAPPAAPMSPEQVVAVASSTGGVWVLGAMLRDLAPQCRAVLIAQHMDAEFVTFLARWIEDVSGWRTVLVEDAAPLEAGAAFVPGGGKDLVAEDGRVRALASTSRFVPNADRLLASVGGLGARAIGVILSGMGTDGAMGLAELVRLGGRAICQDPSSATVPSMPESALRATPDAAIVAPDGLAAAVNARG